MVMTILETERLTLRQLEQTDAPFIFKLLNDPSWIENIGDRGIRTLEDAEAYIINSPNAMYKQHGFSLLLVETKVPVEPIGLCGLIKRDSLDDVDLGYAFLPDFWGKGYAYEAAAAIMDYSQEVHKLSRIVAITLPENKPSVKLMTKLGFQFEETLVLAGDDEELALYGWSP